MEPIDLEIVRDDVISFMNDFIRAADLPLQASRIDDDIYRKLHKLSSGEIDWDWAVQFLNKNEHFDFAIGIQLNDSVDGLAIGIYQHESEILEIQAVESFVRLKEEHPLRGRMVELTIVAATYFVTLVSGKGIHIIDPLDAGLISYYEKFGFRLDASYDETCVKRMVSDLDDQIERLRILIDKYQVK
ncbi:hypothetical protein ACSILE_004159 [Yersinia enterocolitica]|uniref:hypothetical protein n=1 Tax=Yersinia enterocolitica TaxID=630 RepID=UPI001CA4DAAC|nr:hypothetical protein [Yersinia enterocolitica]MBW5835902.1 hypothetical protein [Yersinia enterocolitica]HEN3672448.1 hypothetical protein [Yersinia enterocolitica]